jgi:hypothetical protein
MTDTQLTELEQTFVSSVSSNTIEWSHNMRICDLLQSNPSLTPTFMRLMRAELRKTVSPVPVVLALSLLEIVAKNCGLAFCNFIDEALIEALLALVKRREGWKYSLGRNMFKTFGSSASGYGIDEGSRELWLQASLKVREMLQLWTDAFLLQEGRLRPIFDAYKLLRREGYSFPEKKSGASADICLMAGAEESPAFLAAGGVPFSSDSQTPPADTGRDAEFAAAAGVSATEAAAAAATAELIAAEEASRTAASASRPAEPALRITITPATVDSMREICRELGILRKGSAAVAALPDDPEAGDQRLTELTQKVGAAREEATRQIQRQMESQSPSERYIEALMLLLDDANEALPAQEEEPSAPAAAAAASPTPARAQADLLDLGSPAGAEGTDEDISGSGGDVPLPPPPMEAEPTKEEQERYDEILARYLQERENASVANEEEDAALALRLSLEEEAAASPWRDAHSPSATQASMIRCSQCNAVNQLDPSGGGSGLFICYACGLTQSVPAQHSAAPQRAMRSPGGQQEVRPTRHAPPPRVMTAAGDCELFIGGGKAPPAETPSTGGYVPPTVANAAPSAVQSFEGMGSQTLLGAPPKSSKAWKMSMPSFPTGSSTSSSSAPVKNLGDGVSASEYMSMDNDEGASLFGGGPPGNKSSASSLLRGLIPSRKKKDDEQRESLMARVQVDKEWELIRPADQRPYYYNSTTQASQWQPPDIVSSTTGLLSG